MELQALEHGGVIEAATADVGLAGVLESLVPAGALCVVIEDDLRRSGDPALERLPVGSAVLGDQVLHWCDLPAVSSSLAVSAIRRSASGYPLNAFIVTESAAALGLAGGGSVSTDLPSRIVRALDGVIVAAFDAESFLLWDREERT
jgi:hypothetical protein